MGQGGWKVCIVVIKHMDGVYGASGVLACVA
jgi:hypothetical protein